MVYRVYAATLSMLLISGAAFAETEKSPRWEEDTLLGDFGGVRSTLKNKGLGLEFTHKTDLFGNLSGGIQKGTSWMGYTDAKLSIDLQNLLGWDSSTFFVLFHSELGGKFDRDHVGSFTSVNNIEVGTNTAQLQHAWIQKNWLEDRFSLLTGLYAVDLEFYVTDASAVFTQTPYGMANDLGKSGPPIYPYGAVGMRAKYITPDRNLYLQAALTDGVPGDPSNPHGTQIKLGGGDGVFSIFEMGYKPVKNHLLETSESASLDHSDASPSLNKVAIGYWRYSNSEDNLDPARADAVGNPLRHPNQGIYLLAEQALLIEKEDAAQGLTGFLRIGRTNREIYQSDWTGSLGLNYRGLFAGRNDDIAGIGVTVSHTGSVYQQLNASLDYETSIEATYLAQISNWFAVHPTVQHVIHPNMDPTIPDAWIAGIRLEVTL